GGYGHQDVPFEKLVEELQPQRNLSYSPFFQVMFTFQDVRPSSLEMSDLRFRPLNIISELTPLRSDLDFYLGESSDGLAGHFIYSTDLFNESTIARMSERFSFLSDKLSRDPNMILSDLLFDERAELPSLPVQESSALQIPLSFHQEHLWITDQ